MKLVLCSIFALLLAGCASVVADQPGTGKAPTVTIAETVMGDMELVVKYQDNAEWQIMDLLDLLANQEVMIEALYGELAAYEEAGTEYSYVYEVKPGQSLWVIADEIYGDPYRWISIFSISCDFMVDPDLIYPGQVLVLP